MSLTVDLLYKKSRIHSVTGYDLVLAPEAIGLENVSSSEIFGIASSLTAELGDDWRLQASGFFGPDRTGGYYDLYLGGAQAIDQDKIGRAAGRERERTNVSLSVGVVTINKTK